MALLASAASLTAAVTAVAVAGVAGYRVATQAAVSDLPSQTLTATCPSGMKVLGGGASYEGPASMQLGIAKQRPVGVRGWSATGTKLRAYAHTWRLRVYATCSDSVAGHRILAATVRSTAAVKERTVTCPADSKILGGGAAYVAPATGSTTFLVSKQGPVGTTAWRALGQQIRPFDGTWSLRVYAVCGSVAGHQIVQSTGAPNELRQSVRCPAGKRVLGGGAVYLPRRPAAPFVSSRPVGSVGWSASMQILIPSSQRTWRLRVYAVCGRAS